MPNSSIFFLSPQIALFRTQAAEHVSEALQSSSPRIVTPMITATITITATDPLGVNGHSTDERSSSSFVQTHLILPLPSEPTESPERPAPPAPRKQEEGVIYFP